MLALSATYPEYLAQHLTAYMRNPTFLRLNISDPALLGMTLLNHCCTRAGNILQIERNLHTTDFVICGSLMLF